MRIARKSGCKSSRQFVDCLRSQMHGGFDRLALFAVCRAAQDGESAMRLMAPVGDVAGMAASGQVAPMAGAVLTVRSCG